MIALLAHAPRQQGLAQAVVDLVRAGVQQVLALDVDLRAAVDFAQALGVIERRGPAGVVGEQILQLGLKRRIEARFQIRLLQFFERRHEDFGNVSAAVGTEVSAGVGRLRRSSTVECGMDEFSHFVVILQTGRFLDAGAGVDAPGWACSMAMPNVVGIQAAGDDDLCVPDCGGRDQSQVSPVPP